MHSRVYFDIKLVLNKYCVFYNHIRSWAHAMRRQLRVGACLVPLENNIFVGPFSPSCGEGEAFFI